MDYTKNKKEAIDTLKSVIKWMEKPGKHTDYDPRDFDDILERVKAHYKAYISQNEIQSGLDGVYKQNYLEL